MSQSTHSTSNNTTADQLSAHLATTSIVHDTNGQDVHFPTGTSLDEQLLILAGVEDYMLTGLEGETFSPSEMNRETYYHNDLAHADPARIQNADNDSDPKAAMDAYLALLTATELSSTMYTNLNITDTDIDISTVTIPTPTPFRSPTPFAGFQPSCLPGSLEQSDRAIHDPSLSLHWPKRSRQRPITEL
jgi:hypothetical protein